MDTYDLSESGRRRRRRHSTEFKQSVVRECHKPGVSIAAVALRHQLNASMLRKWVIEAERHGTVVVSHPATALPAPAEPSPPAFVPVAIGTHTDECDIRIQWQRGGTTLHVAWPTSAAQDCAAWLRELMR